MINIFEFLKNKKSADEINQNDEFDKKYGAPKTEGYATDDLIDLLDRIIADVENKNCGEKEQNKKSDFIVSKIIATDSFKNTVKILYRKKRADVLNNIKNVIPGLCQEKSNKKHTDIDIDDEKIELQYSYITDSILILGFKTDAVQKVADI